jgi:hypothetical protein
MRAPPGNCPGANGETAPTACEHMQPLMLCSPGPHNQCSLQVREASAIMKNGGTGPCNKSAFTRGRDLAWRAKFVRGL